MARSLLPPQPPNGPTELHCSAMSQRAVLSQINILKPFLLCFCLFLKLLCCPSEGEDSQRKLKETTGSSWAAAGDAVEVAATPTPLLCHGTATQSGKDVTRGGGREWGRLNCCLRRHKKQGEQHTAVAGKQEASLGQPMSAVAHWCVFT